jgi:precorrin-6Y C5,15-methyltransferase (decarboxylating)
MMPVLCSAVRVIWRWRKQERGRAWPIPFSVEPVLQLRGQQGVAVLVSGDPFHFGAGASLARHLELGEWRNYPQASTFSWVAGELGWSQERTHCLGLHARSLSSLTPLLAPQERFICLLRDGPAAHTLAQWLLQQGWGDSPLWLVEQAGSDQQDIRSGTVRELAALLATQPAKAPVTAAFEARGEKVCPGYQAGPSVSLHMTGRSPKARCAP